MRTTNYFLEKGAKLSNGKYIIETILGNGGFGITYKGFYKKEVDIKERFNNIKTTVSIPVAIKELFIEGKCIRNTDATGLSVQSLSLKNFQDFKDRFLKEAKTLSQFRDIPHIVHVIDYFEENDTAYMVMEFVEGETLTQLVKRKGPLSEEKAVDYILQIANGLVHVHIKNIIHRDIKPDNTIITPDGLAVLIDFGAARGFVADKSVTQSVMLTHGYAPIEQYSLKRKRGPFTDIYALGGTLFFCLTGKKPESIYDRTPDHVMELPNISHSLGMIVNKAMAFNGKDRHQSCKAFIEDLGKIMIPENSNIQKEYSSSEQTILGDSSNENNTIIVDKGDALKISNKQKIKNKKVMILVLSGLILLVSGFFIGATSNAQEIEPYNNEIELNDELNLHKVLDEKSGRKVSGMGYSTLMKTSKSAYFKGEQFNGQIVVAHTDKSITPSRAELTLDGRKLIEEQDFILEEGKVKMKIKTGDVGEHKIKGEIFVNDRSSEIPVVVNSSFVTINKSNAATISLDKMNVLYRGVSNPITISFPGIPDNNVVAKAPGLSKIGGGNYVIDVTLIKRKEVTINVTGTLPDESKVSDHAKFRIKDLPAPIGTFRRATGYMGMSRKYIESSTVGAILFDFNVKLKVTSFDFIVDGQPIITVKGNKLNSRAKNAVRRAKKGSKVIISNIKAQIEGDSSYRLKKVSPIIIKLLN